jgi:CubicO group peptidase (beta-lactamase class C family)
VKFDEPRGQIRRMEGFGLAWQRGTFRDRPYLTHGGGYVGASTHISFMPEQDLGVVVFCNSGGTARGLIDIVSIDVYDRLLGESCHTDLLPRYLERAARIREQIAGSVPTSDNPASAEDGLSLPVTSYPGRYGNEDWGTVELSLADSELTASIGDMPLTLHTMWTDQFNAFASASVSFECEFLVDDNRVTGIRLINDGQTIIFERE